MRYDYSQPYVTKDEYLEVKGVNLDIELQADDNNSNKVNRFIQDLTNFVLDHLVMEYGCNELNRQTHDFEDLAEFRRVRFHYGMLDQIEYVLNNGLIQLNSGINMETGSITDFSAVVIGPAALRQFKLAGFCNKQEKPRCNGSLSPKDMPTIEELVLELGKKVDKVDGKGLSANDYSDSEKMKLNQVVADLDGKVDKEAGKKLTSNDFTNQYKAKLDSVQENAQVNKIEEICLNNEPLTISGKRVNIPLEALGGNKEDKSNKVTALSDQSTDIQYPSAKCVYDNLMRVIEIAEGSTGSYTLSIVDNPSFNSENDSLSGITSFTDINGNVIQVSSLHNGDIILVIETDVPDRWFSISDSKFYMLETRKVDLSDYVQKTSSANKVYGTDNNGDQATLDISVSASNDSVVKRSGTGQVKVAQNPVADEDATSKKYVDTGLGGKQATIDSSHKLNADLVDDSSSNNKFVSASDKTNWNGKADKDVIAPAYDDTATYSVGAKCVYNGKLYTCSTAITQAEDFNSLHWTEISVSSGFVDLDSAQTITGRKTILGENLAFKRSTNDAHYYGISSDGYGGCLTRSGAIYYKWSSGGFFPQSDNSRDCGGNNQRWKDLYLSGSLKDGTNSVSVADISTGLSDVADIKSYLPSGVSSSNKLVTESAITTLKNNTFQDVDITTYATLADFLLSTGEEGIIYLYPIDTTDLTKGYYQYIWESSAWRAMGTTQIDLSNYVDLSSAQTLTGIKTVPRLNFKDGNSVEYSIRNLYNQFGFYYYDIRIASFGGYKWNFDWDISLKGKILTDKNNTYGLTVPDTTSWTANKEIATKEETTPKLLSITSQRHLTSGEAKQCIGGIQVQSDYFLNLGGGILLKNPYITGILISSVNIDITAIGLNPSSQLVLYKGRLTINANDDTVVVSESNITARILDDIADAVDKKHEHSNKSVLDDITAAYTTAEATKLSGIETSAQVNVIESIKVNGTAQTISSKEVDISVPLISAEDYTIQ